MEILSLISSGYPANSYLVTHEGASVLIDAGASLEKVKNAWEQTNTRLVAVILTHAHFDHTRSAAALCRLFKIPLYLSKQDLDMLGDPAKNGLLGLWGRGDTEDYDGVDILPLPGRLSPSGFGLSFEVLETPGHSNGSVCLLIENTLFTGDTLFNGGFGRYDLYGGDPELLRRSLKSLGALPPSFRILPGHGGESSLGTALADIEFFIS